MNIYKIIILILLICLVSGCDQQNNTISTVKHEIEQENKPAQFQQFTTIKNTSFNKSGIEGIKFGDTAQDTITMLKGVKINHPEFSNIRIKDAKMYGIAIPLIVLEYDDSGKLDKIVVNTKTASWQTTLHAMEILNNKLTAIYGKPSIINKISEEYYNNINSANQVYAEWPIVNRRRVISTVTKRDNGYYADLSIFSNSNLSCDNSDETIIALTKTGKRIKSRHPDWDDQTCNTIGSGKISIGMTKAQVRAAWGTPCKVNTTTTAYGSNEQWVMSCDLPTSYVYFEYGTVTAIQN